MLPDNFTEILMMSFKDMIASNFSSYATKTTKITIFVTLNSYVQCIPELSIGDCRYCLERVVNLMPGVCSLDRSWVKVLQRSCNMRYELYTLSNPWVSATNKTGSTKGEYMYLRVINLCVSVCVSVCINHCFMPSRKLCLLSWVWYQTTRYC